MREFSRFPSLFTQDRQPNSDYLCIAEVSSENREYVPIGFLDSKIICNNKLQIIPNGTNYMFGIMQSKTHNVWINLVSGRPKSDMSISLVTIHNWGKNGILKPYKIGNRVRFRLSDIEKVLLQSNRRASQ